MANPIPKKVIQAREAVTAQHGTPWAPILRGHVPEAGKRVKRRPGALSDALAWNFAVPDWQERLKSGKSLLPKLPLDVDAAARAVAAFNMLRLADCPGTPTMEEACGDWFRDIIRALFGSIDESGERRVRELFCLVSKKNSKTSSSALLMLTALLLNERPRAPFILTAPVQEVANLAFAQVAGAIALDPVLEKKLHVRDHLKTIEHRETKGKLQILTFDPAILTGQKCCGVLIDELHISSKKAQASNALRQLRGGMLPFPEAFMMFITTQSEEPPSGVFKAELTKARGIRDGKIKGSMLPILYEFPDEMQKNGEWRDPKHWALVNPNEGRSITVPRLVEEYQAAEQSGEEELRGWASQHLNVEVGLALHTDRWSGADFWEARGEKLTLDDLLRRSEVVTVGIDGGGLDDMLGLAVIGREAGTGKWLHWAHAWVHPVVLERRKQLAEKMRDFQRDGDLTIIKNIGEDVTQLTAFVKRCEDAGLLDRVGVDQLGIGSIVDSMMGIKIEMDRIVGIPQGWKLMGAIKTLERRLAEGGLVHGASPMMAWTVGNAKIEPRGNAIMITKQISGSAKIDPLMATFDAAALMSLDPKPRKKAYQAYFI